MTPNISPQWMLVPIRTLAAAIALYQSLSLTYRAILTSYSFQSLNYFKNFF